MHGTLEATEQNETYERNKKSKLRDIDSSYWEMKGKMKKWIFVRTVHDRIVRNLLVLTKFSVQPFWCMRGIYVCSYRRTAQKKKMSVFSLFSAFLVGFIGAAAPRRERRK